MRCDAMRCDAMRCDVMRCDVMWCDVMWCDVIYYIILYYTILYYTILYYTILYYTILYRGACFLTCHSIVRWKRALAGPARRPPGPSRTPPDWRRAARPRSTLLRDCLLSACVLLCICYSLLCLCCAMFMLCVCLVLPLFVCSCLIHLAERLRGRTRWQRLRGRVWQASRNGFLSRAAVTFPVKTQLCLGRRARGRIFALDKHRNVTKLNRRANCMAWNNTCFLDTGKADVRRHAALVSMSTAVRTGWANEEFTRLARD